MRIVVVKPFSVGNSQLQEVLKLALLWLHIGACIATCGREADILTAIRPSGLDKL